MARTQVNNVSAISTVTPTPPVTITGETNLGVYNFVDDSGNLTEIKKKLRPRDKYNADQRFITEDLVGEVYVIGVSGPLGGSPFTNGDIMGCGDDTAAYAIY